MSWWRSSGERWLPSCRLPVVVDETAASTSARRRDVSRGGLSASRPPGNRGRGLGIHRSDALNAPGAPRQLGVGSAPWSTRPRRLGRVRRPQGADHHGSTTRAMRREDCRSSRRWCDVSSTRAPASFEVTGLPPAQPEQETGVGLLYQAVAERLGDLDWPRFGRPPSVARAKEPQQACWAELTWK